MSPASQSSACKLVILISGSGSNLQSFIDGCQNNSLNAEISAVFCNRPGAYGLERASAANINTELVDHTEFNSLTRAPARQ